MPKRITLQTVVLWRDGKQVVPQINKPFDYTTDELANIEKLNPDAIGKIINSDGNDTLVTKTQAEIDADTNAAVAAAIAAFKKEQGIKDGETQPATGDAKSTGKAADKSTAKSSDKAAGKDATADDGDI